MAQTKVTQDTLHNAVNLLSDVSEGRGPTAGELAKIREFNVQVAKCAEGFAHVIVEEYDLLLRKQGKKALFGKPAVEYCFGKCQHMVGVKESEDLMSFRMFAWVLSPTEHPQVLSWEKAAVHGAKERLRDNKAKALKDTSDSVACSKRRGA